MNSPNQLKNENILYLPMCSGCPSQRQLIARIFHATLHAL